MLERTKEVPSHFRRPALGVFQATVGYCFSWLFEHNDGDYLLLFRLGGCAVTLALAIDLVMTLTVARSLSGTRR